MQQEFQIPSTLGTSISAFQAKLSLTTFVFEVGPDLAKGRLWANFLTLA